MFKFFAGTNKYIFRTLIFGGWIVLFASIAMSFSGSLTSDLIYIIQMQSTRFETFPDLFEVMFGRFNIWLYLISFVMITVCSAVYFGYVEGHMRLGIRGFNRFLAKLNDNFIVVLMSIAAIAILFLLLSVVECSLVFATHRLLSQPQMPPTATAHVVASIIILAFWAVRILIISAVLLIPPSYIIIGYPFIDNLLYSNRLYQMAPIKLYLSCLLPFLVGFAAEGVFAILSIFEIYSIEPFFIRLITNVYILLYIIALSMTAYFDLTNTERKDLRIKYYYRYKK